jgi:hypothetical protein
MTFRQAAENLVNTVLEPKIRMAFTITAQSLFQRIADDDFRFQSQTNNLRASTGIGVFRNDVLTDWISNPDIPINSSPKFTSKGITGVLADGNDLLSEALYSTHMADGADWTFYVVSAAPYASFVDDGGGGVKRGYGWWSEDLIQFIQEELIDNLKLQGL